MKKETRSISGGGAGWDGCKKRRENELCKCGEKKQLKIDLNYRLLSFMAEIINLSDPN